MSNVPAHPDQQPDQNRATADEQRIGALLHAVEAPAPAALHARIAALAAEPRNGRFTLTLALSGSLAAAAVVIALALSGGPAAPTARAVSQIALERPTGQAPRAPVAAGTAIAFPRWSARGWPASGARSDRLGGRTVTTEFYDSYGGGTLGYSIVAGAALRWGTGGRLVSRPGGRYWVALAADGARIVSWVQAGHTCVLASRSASSATLLELAVAEHGSSPV
jgi:hypothetical protein